MNARTKKLIVMTAVCVALNLGMAFVKLFVGIRVNSICILLDATNGFLDTATGLVTIIAFCLVSVKPSEKFPFGLGRSEYVAGFIVAAVATAMGAVFLWNSLARLSMPEPVWFSWLNWILITATLPVKLAIAIFFVRENKKLGSKAIAAIAADSFLDVGITSATVISFSLSAVADYAVDAIFGIVISIVIVIVSVKMVADNLKILVGSNSCKEERERIIASCEADKNVLTVSKIRLHDYGYRACYGTAKLKYAPDLTIDEIKKTNETLKRIIKEETGAEIEFMSVSEETEEIK